MYSSALRTLKLQGENYSESLRFLYEKQRITKAVHLHRCDRHLIGIEAQYGEDVEPFRFRVKKKNALQGEQSLQREFNSKGMMLPLVSAATPP